MRKEPPAVRRRAVMRWTLLIVLAILFFYIAYVSVRGTMLIPKSTDTSSNLAAPYEAR